MTMIEYLGRCWAKRYLWAGFLAVVVIGMASAIAGVVQNAATVVHATSALGQAPVDKTPANKNNIVGHTKCAECHKSEVAAWTKSPHGSKSYQMLSSTKAPEYAKAMSITGPLASSICGDCHATKTASVTIKGVSCESCHGAAGPAASGWLAVHSSFGNAEKDRTKETKEHYAARIAACGKLGMNRSADVYAIAHNCLSCHTVTNEKLVNAGHPTSKQFELVEWAQGSVRHNFQLDQKVNAAAPSLWLDPLHNGAGRTAENRKKLMYVVGKLVDLEISLRSRAKASEGDYGSAVSRRISSAVRALGKIDHVAEVKQALGALGAIDRKALRKFAGDDAKLYGDAAENVAAAAKALSKANDGSKLGDVKVVKDAAGDPYSP
ncbi:MAG: cytochrome c family protein [Planctomycetes bacterium]|nr:cytochrome c family protein [Planctomycetota bacterium]